ncbi:Crp/Fnr family transcriptional regulator [Streptomyces halobius]|uniref:Crp/Fnr family transcriptional regulator n=1 Tax=Streptomyces halobius TaxID=2879846 RepID=A0ABY4M085_9ACTN|nr:Crp/Fnr family transcriptional regulator [Streptomyces halobius]UQA91103.1 Crp/Fnr family transcriptional regulator [Streptomyces halobius]
MTQPQHHGRRLAVLTGPPQEQLKAAAWVARCIGRGEHAPLRREDVAALADILRPVPVRPGTVVTSAGAAPSGVWILRSGSAELAVGSGPRQVVVQILHPGDIDGDVQMLLHMPVPYTTRALETGEFLHLSNADFDRVLQRHPAIARRWLTSISTRLAHSQARLTALLGGTLIQQTARLLLDEAADGAVHLPQRTLAAMLGARRPSLNKALKELERRGAVRLAYRTIEITDSAALRNLAA